MIPQPTKANESSAGNIEDERLAAELRGGNDQALAILYERHCLIVYRIARRILGNDADAEEIVQQVFLQVYKHIDQFDPSKSKLLSWLVSIATNSAIDLKRRLLSRGTYASVPFDDGAAQPWMPQPIVTMAPQEISHLVSEMLDLLTPEEQTVINLHYYGGLTLEEVHRELETSFSITKRMYYGALKKLQLRVAAQCGGGRARTS